MAKKHSLPPKTPLTMPAEAEGIVDEAYTEGKGVLKKTVIRHNQDFWNRFKEMIRETSAREDSVEIRKKMKDRLLESLILGIEIWAKAILDRAGLPHDANNGKLTDLVESSGFPFGKVEWHAAALLTTTRTLRMAVKEGDVVGVAIKAIRLGEFMEQRLRFGYVAERTQPGGKGRGAQRKATVAERDANLRSLAEKIRPKHPDWSERDVAGHLERLPRKPAGTLSEDRIRKIIKPA